MPPSNYVCVCVPTWACLGVLARQIQFFKAEGARGFKGAMCVKKPNSRGGEAGPAPVCLEYRGSISPTRG